MKRRKTPGLAVVAARSRGLSSITAAREAKRAKPHSSASSVAPPLDAGTDRPAASQRAGPFPPPVDRTPHRTGAVVPLLRTARRRRVEVTPQYVYQPHPPGSYAHAPQLSPSRCVHRWAQHARTHNLQTALWGRLLRRLRLHRSSPPRRPRSSLPRRPGRCLPACRCARPAHAHAHARPPVHLSTGVTRKPQERCFQGRGLVRACSTLRLNTNTRRCGIQAVRSGSKPYVLDRTKAAIQALAPSGAGSKCQRTGLTLRAASHPDGGAAVHTASLLVGDCPCHTC